MLERCVRGGAEDLTPMEDHLLRLTCARVFLAPKASSIWPCILKLITQIVGESGDERYKSQFGKSLMSHVNEAECDFCTF